MRNPLSLLVILIPLMNIAFSGTDAGNDLIQTDNTVMFGGARILVDMTDCSTNNSTDGRSRSIAAISNESSSMCIVQFGTRDPASGTYTTVTEEPVGPGQVILSGTGALYDGRFVAVAGQAIIVTNSTGRYYTAFRDLLVSDPDSRKFNAKKISGSFGCN
ncbi:MAG: hypothetical protein WDN75_06540 [Bacteroidota bacterium]